MLNAKDVDKQLETLLVVGTTGSGKTSGFLTLPGKKFMYIFDPNSLATLRGHDVDYELFLPERLDLDVVTLKANIRDRASKSLEPKTYNMFERDIEAKMESGFFDSYDAIGVDSVTTLTDVVMDRCTFLNNHFGKNPEMVDYVATTNTVIKIFRTFLGFEKPLYVTGHIEFKQEEATSKMQNVMAFLGRLRQRMPILFSEVWLAYAEPDKDKKMHYYVRTQQDRYNPFLRCTSKFVDPVEDVTIDWSRDPEGQGIGELLGRTSISKGD